MTKVLLLGAGGMLATDVIRCAPPGVSLVAATARDVDITDATAVHAAVADVRPSWIINAAAYTKVDEAERERAAAEAVNGHALGHIGAVAREFDCGVVHYGTDYVFDGARDGSYREDDETHPINAYGASKLLGEIALRSSGARYLLLRTQWLFGLAGPSFPRTMWERAASGRATRVVNDQFGCPTYSADLAAATWRLLGEVGCWHVTNAGATTWHDVARVVFARAGARELLRPCSSVEYPTAAPRPRNTALSTEKLGRAGVVLPPWRDALDRFLDELEREGGAPRPA